MEAMLWRLMLDGQEHVLSYQPWRSAMLPEMLLDKGSDIPLRWQSASGTDGVTRIATFELAGSSVGAPLGPRRR